MHSIKNNQFGFGILGVALATLILIGLSAGSWFVYKHQNKTASSAVSTKTTDDTRSTTTAADPTSNWKKVDSIGGAYSMKVPDGWELTNYPGNVLMGDNITFSAGTPAVITTASSAYAGDQKRFSVGFTDNTKGQNSAPQWQSPNPYGTETKTDFSIGSIKGVRYSIEYTQTVTGVTKGDKVYQYVFDLPGNKGLGAVYIQKAGDADNLKTVEQAIHSIVIN